MTSAAIPHCWCGNTDLARFSADYLKCGACETLVVARMPDPAALHVGDDEAGLYGRQYYESCLVERYGFPKLADRTWMDLPERCLHWLRAVLAYKTPPARALELGSAHGAFVALLRWAGFDATGLELSPWLVGFARETFGVPMLQGPVEAQALEAGSLEVVAAMDVLEHLSDPAGTLRHCLGLLKPGGVFLAQTPRYPEGATYAELAARNDPFMHHFKPEQHLYLFSERSVRGFFESLGAPHIEFLPAIFGHYDMFVVASRAPLARRGPEEIRASLLATPGGRLVEALLQKDDALQQATDRSAECAAACAACEADRAARLEVIERQGQALGELSAERDHLRTDLEAAAEHLAASEADRAARLEVIERQGREFGEVQAERNNLGAELEDLRRHFALLEQDHAARLEVIERQGREFGEVQAERNNLRAELEDLRRHFELSEQDRAARLEVIDRQGRELGELEAERDGLRAERDTQRGQMAAYEAERAARLEMIERQSRCLSELETERNRIQAEFEQMRCQYKEHLADLDRQVCQLRAALAARQQVLLQIQNNRVYRIIRSIGGWKQVEEMLSQEAGFASADEHR